MPDRDLAPLPSCRDACLETGEPLAGSAGAAAIWIGIAWPKPLWHPSSVERSEGLPDDLSSLADDARAAGEKLALRLFQRSARPSTERVEMVLARPGQGRRVHEVPVARISSIARAFIRREPLGDEAEELGPELFVCTDGKHDVCCARLGRPLYDALLREREASGVGVGIAEASHLGGHRFAANCLALPGGHLYGRVRPDEARALLAATAGGGVWSVRLRGRMGAGELAEVAELFAREHGLADAEIRVGDAVLGTDVARVPLDAGPRGCFWVECELRTFEGRASCGPAAPVEARRRWLPRSIHPEPGVAPSPASAG